MSTIRPALISAKARLKTFELFLHLRSTNQVAKELGFTPAAVRARLNSLGFDLDARIRYCANGPRDPVNAEFIAGIRNELSRQMALEAVCGAPTYVGRGPGISAAEKLQTLELYEQYMSCLQVGKELGLAASVIRDRLMSMGVTLRPRGRGKASLEDFNRRGSLDSLKSRLRARIAAEEAGSKAAQ